MDRIKRLMDLDHCFFFELPDRIESKSRKRNFKLSVLIGWFYGNCLSKELLSNAKQCEAPELQKINFELSCDGR